MPDRLQRTVHDTFGDVRALLEDLRAMGLYDHPVTDLQSLTPCPPGQTGIDRGGVELCRQENLEEIRQEMIDCSHCPLRGLQNRIVFGDGDSRAKVLFVGSMPVRGDEAAGLPFAGEFYRRILFAMGFDRSSVYTTFAIKCHPASRTGYDKELAACTPFLYRQIASIAPKVIVAMGELAVKVLTGQNEELHSVRGKWGKYRGIDVMPTYDPPYLVQHPHEKRDFWNDLKEIIRHLRQEG